jgi:hypothetical protein
MTDQSKPNFVHCNGDSTYSRHFGTLLTVTPVTLGGQSQRQTINLAFRYGVHMELTPYEATELARRIPEALAALTVQPNVSGAVADLEEM